jgi:diaminopimelate epimerase
MEQITFTKMQALGNNYIYVNMFEQSLQESQLSEIAIKVSNVHTGIGSDGLILICPSEHAPVKMRIFNNDGSEGKNCGNGLRCVAKYAYERNLVKDKEFYIETLSGLVRAEIFEHDGIVESVTVDMGEPRLTRGQLPMKGNTDDLVISEPLHVNDEVHTVTGVSMGNPHIILFVDDVEKAPVTTLGPILEKDERFPDGANVEFVDMVSHNEFNFRVWERGSGVTQACGTGACAAAVAAILNNKATKGEEIIIHLAGGDLTINWQENGRVLMTGPAKFVVDGVFYYER